MKSFANGNGPGALDSKFQRDQGMDIRPVTHWEFNEPRTPLS